jgi:hypothetical protein
MEHKEIIHNINTLELIDKLIKISNTLKCDVEELQDQYDDVVREYFKAKEELSLKVKIIETLNKVILSQEQEIKELRNQEYYDKKRRAWHY